MKKYLFLIFLVMALFIGAKAQSSDSLSQLTTYSFPVYYSAGHQQRAEATASRVEHAIAMYRDLLEFTPQITLFILREADWQTHTTEQAVYGMPHYNAKTKRLIVAAEDNAFWRSFLPPLGQLPENLREAIKATYSTGNGLSMQAFFDLLAIHELGHAFHIQGGLTMQRQWMGELFCNILLHTYIAEKEPALLPALTLFPGMVIAGGTKEFKYTSLQDIQERYNEIGQQYPKNYGWYQCRWHAAAAAIYQAAGIKLCRKLWDALRENKEILTDEKLVDFFETKTDKSIANMIKYWDQTIIW